MTDFHPATVKAKDNEILEQNAGIERMAQREREQEERIKYAEENARQLKKDLEDILSSRSWRITAVFRTAREKAFGKDTKP